MAGEPRKKSIIAVTVAAVGLLTLAAVIPVLAPDGVFAHTAGRIFLTIRVIGRAGSVREDPIGCQYRNHRGQVSRPTAATVTAIMLFFLGSPAILILLVVGRAGGGSAGKPSLLIPIYSAIMGGEH